MIVDACRADRRTAPRAQKALVPPGIAAQYLCSSWWTVWIDPRLASRTRTIRAWPAPAGRAKDAPDAAEPQ